MTRRKKPKDPTVNIRMRRYRERLKAHERRPTITVGPTVTEAMTKLGLLTEGDLENNERLGKVCEMTLKTWAEDRDKWYEQVFTRNTIDRK
jgi:hypothetical protein